MDDSPSTNRIYDYEDIGWAENRSKRLHDPLLMANVKDGKKKKDGASFSKIQDNTQDAFQMGILYFINSFVLSQLPETPIPVNDFLMVEDVVNEKIVVKEGDYIPRILNWRVVGVKPKFEMFMSTIFTEKTAARSLSISDEEDKRGNDDVSEPPSTVDVSIAGNVSKKVFGLRNVYTAYAEYLSDGIPVLKIGFCSEDLRTRYGSL
ncbi:hypothetical protein MTR67_027811 [Solanum verrucosum]|uniref:Ulp1 protease family, C-terminal catalytic domain containing protein n=1 Tax=Solanum verrucosum TaxID=315347 RepID=A0AAF0R2X6_SOLVR|nr:hypothetical protein MTR67_027811 [Solanum verrucosum]